MAHASQHCLLQWDALSKNPLRKYPESERIAIYDLICKNVMCKLTFPQTSSEAKVRKILQDLHA